jgi:outer membrane protein assembly factor BamA
MQAARIWSVGMQLIHDWPDHPGQPSRGGHESISLQYQKGVDRSEDLKYVITRVDIRHYLNIYKKRLLALRVLVEALDRIGNSPAAPFYLRPSLGGGNDLRGYRTRRFTDNNLAMVSIEYRYPIWDAADAFIFLDEGRVFNPFTDSFTFSNWQYSAGGGIRIWSNGGLILSTLVAAGKEGARFYLELSESL